MTRSLQRELRRLHGFTLIEIVVATAVGAIVLLAVNATFFGALRLHESTHRQIDAGLGLQRALATIRRDFSGVMLPGGVLSGAFQSSPSSPAAQDVPGDRVSPDLYTTTGRVDGWTSFSEAQAVAYYLVPSAPGENVKNLVRVVTRNLLPAQAATSDGVVLLSHVTDAAVAFYDGADWTDSWDSAASSTLPAAVKFQLTLAPAAQGQRAPAPIELVIPVPVVAQSTETTGT